MFGKFADFYEFAEHFLPYEGLFMPGGVESRPYDITGDTHRFRFCSSPVRFYPTASRPAR